MRSIVITGLCAFSILAAQAQADVIEFDPDGAAGGNGTVSVATFDFLPGNSLARNAADPVYTQYAQGRLAGILDANSQRIPVAGLDTAFEITIVAQYEGTASAFGNMVSLGLDGGGTNFVRMYYDDTPDASDLTGAGFDDGLLIYEGQVTDAFGSLMFSTADPVLFDQFVVDNYGNQATRRAIGALDVTSDVSDTHDDFFKSTVVAFGVNTVNKTPFAEVDPSGAFLGYVPQLGAVNGTGLDTQLQTDANGSFVIPEPATLALIGLGGLALLRRRND